MSPVEESMSLRNLQAGRSRINFYERIINFVFRPMTLGELMMDLPDGRRLVYGTGQGGVKARIRVRREAFFKKCVLYGDVGFGEAYVDGDWDTDDIVSVIEWMIQNVETHPTLMSDREKKSPVNFMRIFNNLISLVRRNTVLGSRHNIQEHYDLGNDFYKIFLDPSMTYSSGYFQDDVIGLEDAQKNKYEKMCLKLRLKKDDHLLEIGSGWGGMAVYAAQNFGCRVTTTTISSRQYEYARALVQSEGLHDRVTVLLQDYRDLEGRFDKIVSIEMLEAVGHEYFGDYFRKIHGLLDKNGLLGLQVILSPDNRYESFRKNIDWIQKHIFPGSLLPSVSVIQKAISRTGDLCLYDFEDMTRHYVKTLEMWFHNFNARIEQVKACGFDEIFIRKWIYYFCYCQAAFKTRNIAVARMIYSRPNNHATLQ